jgi:hypothetical protein
MDETQLLGEFQPDCSLTEAGNAIDPEMVFAELESDRRRMVLDRLQADDVFVELNRGSCMVPSSSNPCRAYKGMFLGFVDSR